jgi:hypothetical protein
MCGGRHDWGSVSECCCCGGHSQHSCGCGHPSGCHCGCHHGSGSASQCGCGGGHSQHGCSGDHALRFHRRFRSRDDEVADLEQYLRDLEAEAKGVRERLAEVRAT